MATTLLCSTLSPNPLKTLPISSSSHRDRPFPSASAFSFPRALGARHGVGIQRVVATHLGKRRIERGICCSVSASFPNNTNYEFNDGTSEVELRLLMNEKEGLSSKDIHVDADGRSLLIQLKQSGFSRTLMETNQLFDRIKPGETIWYLDDEHLVINLKKQDPELKWPDIVESWESLSTGIKQLLKGTSIFLVGESSEINQKVALELAVGLGYMPLETKGMLEELAKTTIDSWALAEGSDSVVEAETAVLEQLSTHVRAVIATLGEGHGAASRADNWQYLYAGFTVWLSPSEAIDEDSAKEEARRQVHGGAEAYGKADVVVKLSGWDPVHAKAVAQAALSALKQRILSDRSLPGKKSLYIRLGCRGDWPNIKPPGWDPSSKAEAGSTF